MGPRKGGKAFLKSTVRRGAPAEDEDGQQQSADLEVAKEAPPAAAAAPSQSAISSKAAAFLREAPAAADSPSSDDGGEPGVETRGKMLQRHKKEQKGLKDQVKRLGKKGKEESARLEADMAARHAAELASLDGARERTVAEAVAVADSLYTVHLGGEEAGEGQGASKKQSKSQKRREQRQREEAEREARIQAELAELGDTERVVEERELRAILQPLGLAVHQIPPDGHCLYRSLEDQLQRLPAELAPPAAADGEGGDELNFLLLRQLAADHMRQHADDFKPFVLEGDAAASSGDDAFEAYCSELESTAAWGGHVELQALAHALRSHIVVYCAGLPLVELGEHYKDTGRTLRVCYLRHAYGLGEHYESVVPGLVSVEEEEEGGEEEGERPGDDDVAKLHGGAGQLQP